MNLDFYREKLESLDDFRKFREENPEAFLCSGFFVIDKEGNDNKQHFDFFVPETGKMFSFQLEEEKMVPLENHGENFVPGEISEEVEFDLDWVEEKILDEMSRKEVKNRMQKLIFSLQKTEGGNFLLGTVFLTGFGMLKVNVNLDKREITDFQKSSFFDMVKVFRKEDRAN